MKKGKPITKALAAKKPEVKAAPLAKCPLCGCNVRVNRLKLHVERCKQISIRVEQPARTAKITSVVKIVRLPAQVAATDTPSLRLKQDNICRSWVQRDLKELRRRLSHLPVCCGVEHQEVCRLFEGRYILVDQLLAQFLTTQQLPAPDFLGGKVLQAFREYVHAFALEPLFEQLPLRPNVSLLSPAARSGLASEIESLRRAAQA